MKNAPDYSSAFFYGSNFIFSHPLMHSFYFLSKGCLVLPSPSTFTASTFRSLFFFSPRLFPCHHFLFSHPLVPFLSSLFPPLFIFRFPSHSLFSLRFFLSFHTPRYLLFLFSPRLFPLTLVPFAVVFLFYFRVLFSS